MIQDLFLRMDYQSTITTSGQSASFIDTLAAGDAMPDGTLALWKVICYTAPTAPSGTISGSLTISLQTCNNNLFDSTAVTLAATSALTLSLINVQTANIAPPQATNWPYTPAANPVLGPILVFAPLPFGCLEFIRIGYVFTGNFASIGITSEIVLSGDKLIYDVLSPNQGSLIK